MLISSDFRLVLTTITSPENPPEVAVVVAVVEAEEAVPEVVPELTLPEETEAKAR
jgi:hypothetical protein